MIKRILLLGTWFLMSLGSAHAASNTMDKKILKAVTQGDLTYLGKWLKQARTQDLNRSFEGKIYSSQQLSMVKRK